MSMRSDVHQQIRFSLIEEDGSPKLFGFNFFGTWKLKLEKFDLSIFERYNNLINVMRDQRTLQYSKDNNDKYRVSLISGA